MSNSKYDWRDLGVDKDGTPNMIPASERKRRRLKNKRARMARKRNRQQQF